MNTHPAAEAANLTANQSARQSPWGGSVLGYSSAGFAFVVLALISFLCSNRADSKEPVQVALRPQPVATVAAATLAAADTPSGVFKGVVTFKGTPPEPKLVHKKDDPKVEKPDDRAICAAADYFSDEFLCNEKAGNGVANVVIYIEKTPAGYTPPPVPEEPAVFDQKGCRFIPHLLVVRVNQKMLIKSDDNLTHNTHITSLRNPEFNKVISANDRVGVEYMYKKPERLPVPVKCDLHNWMKAHHLPLEHPLAAVTDADGKFEIKGLPPGKHKFNIWHEMCGYLKRDLEVDIKADKPTEENLSYTKEQFFKQ